MAARAASALLLAGPTLLAFHSGGYFAVPRLIAALAAAVLVAAVALAAPAPLPRGRAGRLALAGLALLAVLQLASVAWAPLRGPAIDDASRTALYLLVLVAAIAVLRGAGARAAEPALLAGIVLVVAYGLSERLLPGLVELDRSRSAIGRLEQPLSYWNAMGALAAIGLVLALRMAGDAARGPRFAPLVAAVAPLLGAGILLAFSRGALLALAAGVLVLAVAGGRAQARALVPGLTTAALAGAGAALLPAVRTLEGARESDGALLLGWLAILAAAGVVLARRRPAEPSTTGDRLPAKALVGVAAVVVAMVALSAAVEGVPGGNPADGATAARLASTGSNRYEYWRVAVGAFAAQPVVGVGSGGFAQVWLRERDIGERVRDAHSLPIETAAELGLLGLLALAALAASVALAARRGLRDDRGLALGPVAVLAAWAVHASIDWDWEMPALTLVAVLLAGLLIAAAEPGTAVRTRLIPRLALAAAVVALAAGLAVELRASRLTDRSISLAFDRSASFEERHDVLRRARERNVDSFPDVLDADLLRRAGREREAVAILERVVRDEPENSVAWLRLAVTTQATDPRRSAEAARRARSLAPPVPGDEG